MHYVRSSLISLVMPPPDPIINIRHRLFLGDYTVYNGRDLFSMYSGNRYQFHNITGETPESLRDLVTELQMRPPRNFKLSPPNRVLMVLIWIRCYPTFAALATMFNVSTAIVHVEIRRMISLCHEKLGHYITWPSVDEWRAKRGHWDNLFPAVGAIDGTSHEVRRPLNEPQGHYYSGYRKFHAVHTQVIVDNEGIVRHVESGFPGHLNDAQQFNLMTQIGGPQLPFPGDCILLADKIYPNRDPIMTPYTTQQIRRRDARQQRKCSKLNRLIQRNRVCVEHAIGEIKQYQSVSTVWRHSKRMLPQVVKICACLMRRRKQRN